MNYAAWYHKGIRGFEVQALGMTNLSFKGKLSLDIWIMATSYACETYSGYC